MIIRSAAAKDRPAMLAIGDRLASFGPRTRPASDITRREHRTLTEALDVNTEGTELFVAESPGNEVVGILLMESREDYFTGQRHAHVSIVAVAPEVEGRGVGHALLQYAEEWAIRRGFRRITLSVFADNRRAKEFYAQHGWQVEMETHFKELKAP